MNELDKILNRIRSSKLPITFPDDREIMPLSAKELVTAFEIAKIAYKKPKHIAEEYFPGLCFILNGNVGEYMQEWYSFLGLKGWNCTTYWIEPAYAEEEDFEALCNARVMLCDAIIESLTKHYITQNNT